MFARRKCKKIRVRMGEGGGGWPVHFLKQNGATFCPVVGPDSHGSQNFGKPDRALDPHQSEKGQIRIRINVKTGSISASN
jgi:hypothetical protein